MAPKLTSGLVDTLVLTEYGEHSKFEAAEVTVGFTRCLIVLEPQARTDHAIAWTDKREDDWRTAVENYVMGYVNDLEGVKGEAWLTYDPARDNTEEMLLGHYRANEYGYIQFDREDEIA